MTDSYVLDGDSVRVTIGGVDERVRVLGVDAPEQEMCGADAARDRLRELLASGQIVVVRDAVADERDRFGRILGYLEVDGVDAGGALISEGLAAAWWPKSEPEPTRGAGYLAAQEAARSQGLGSWGLCGTIGRGGEQG